MKTFTKLQAKYPYTNTSDLCTARYQTSYWETRSPILRPVTNRKNKSGNHSNDCALWGERCWWLIRAASTMTSSTKQHQHDDESKWIMSRVNETRNMVVRRRALLVAWHPTPQQWALPLQEMINYSSDNRLIIDQYNWSSQTPATSKFSNSCQLTSMFDEVVSSLPVFLNKSNILNLTRLFEGKT